MYPAEHTMQHQLEHELWLNELAFLHQEIELMKQHLSDIYYSEAHDAIMHLIKDYDEKFSLQKEWLEKMKCELENYEPPEADEETGMSIKKSFRRQMQANRIINEELKNSFLKLLS